MTRTNFLHTTFLPIPPQKYCFQCARCSSSQSPIFYCNKIFLFRTWEDSPCSHFVFARDYIYHSTPGPLAKTVWELHAGTFNTKPKITGDFHEKQRHLFYKEKFKVYPCCDSCEHGRWYKEGRWCANSNSSFNRTHSNELCRRCEYYEVYARDKSALQIERLTFTEYMFKERILF